jgi:hypothetical protein
MGLGVLEDRKLEHVPGTYEPKLRSELINKRS